jgi:DNA-binding MarR family transcriptional regulator
MATWLLLTNHALVLYYLGRKPLITAREVAQEIGITERAVRKIIADLDAAEFIHKAREGRRVRYTINAEAALRKLPQSEVPILDFLKVLGWKKP